MCFFAPADVEKSNSEVPGQLVTQGYNNWKKAMEIIIQPNIRNGKCYSNQYW